MSFSDIVAIELALFLGVITYQIISWFWFGKKRGKDR